ncbi:hypothetical protein [Allohahella marinimesophila]|uniref:Uncharacterized protein n=1 Tax=Allohahella marinimesophila TaxID=1054972 RepID=A0ABP7NYR5_9GAMM
MNPLQNTLLTIGILLSSTVASAVELAKYPKAYTANPGITVIVAPTQDGQQALVQMSGLNSERDDVMFLTDIESIGNSSEGYRTEFDGRRINLIIKNQGWGGEYLAIFPGGEKTILYFDEDKTEPLKPEHLLAIYNQQKADGVQEKLAKFDREKHVNLAVEGLKEADAEAAAACDSNIQTNVIWDSVSDDLLKSVSINGYCRTVVSELSSLCAESSDIKALAAQLETVNCRFGDSLKIDHDKSEVDFVTAKDEPNQQEFVKSYFRNL